jgi:putative Holliday junction resolvase
MASYPGRVLGVDYGAKRVGVAASDPTRLIAQGVATFDNDGRLFDRLVEVMRTQEVTLIVVGIPFAPDGGKSAKASEVEQFIERLRKHTTTTITTWDESFSSVNAQRAFIDAGMKKRKRQQKARVDEMAARLMLQDFLDHGQHG